MWLLKETYISFYNCNNCNVTPFISDLLVVVRLAADDGAGAVDLLGEDETYHLVGECHSGE